MLWQIVPLLFALGVASSGVFACGEVKPFKLVLRGPVVPAEALAKDLKSRLPCRQESSALACMCRPVAQANIEVAVGFRWKATQLSQISAERMAELGNALRAIEGYSGATLKPVPLTKPGERVPRGLAQQRKGALSQMLSPESPAALAPAATHLQAQRPAPRWVVQKYVISAVFV